MPGQLLPRILGFGTGPLVMSDADGKLSGTMTDCLAKEGLPVLTFLSTKLYLDESFMPFDC